MNNSRIEFYQRGKGFYWRLVASNGRVLARSGERYYSLKAAKASLTVTRNLFVHTQIPHEVIT